MDDLPFLRLCTPKWRENYDFSQRATKLRAAGVQGTKISMQSHSRCS